MNNMVVISRSSGEGCRRYNDLFVHSNIFISMTHTYVYTYIYSVYIYIFIIYVCGGGP